MSDHFGLNLDFDELLSVINSDHIIDEFWENNHAPEMCSDARWLFTWVFDGVAGSLELLDEVDVLDSEFTGNVTATLRTEELNKLWDFHGAEVVECLAAKSVVSLRKLGHFVFRLKRKKGRGPSKPNDRNAVGANSTGLQAKCEPAVIG